MWHCHIWRRSSGSTSANVQWVVTAYILAFGSLLLLGGRIADYWGRKRTFVVGLLGFAAASALGGVSQSEGQMFAARALQGMFAALLAPAALSLVTVAFTEPKERAKAFGVFGALSGAGAAIGLILGGILTDGPGWRWVMWVNVPFAIVTAIFAIVIVRESKAAGHPHFDIPGAALATLGLLSLVYGLSRVCLGSARLGGPVGHCHARARRDPAGVVRLVRTSHRPPVAAAAHPGGPGARRLVSSRS